MARFFPSQRRVVFPTGLSFHRAAAILSRLRCYVGYTCAVCMAAAHYAKQTLIPSLKH